MSEFIITIENIKKKVNILDENKASVDGKVLGYELLNLNCNKYLLRIDNIFYEISGEKIDNGTFSLLVNGKKIIANAKTELEDRVTKLIENAKITSNLNLEVKAPMPGMIIKIKKQVGSKIEAGESVLILEAMKMENDLRTPASGTIKKLFVAEGSTVEKGEILFSME
jgi:biotin carboxyl carrier protein